MEQGIRQCWVWLVIFITALVSHQASAQSFDPNFDPDGCAPMLGKFKGPAGLWDFGNGKFVTMPVDAGGGRLFGAGTYKIRFKSANDSIMEVGTIKVNPSPAVNFSVTSAVSGCAPFTVKFEDLTSVPFGTNIVKRIWDFGPTGTESVGPFASYTYTVPGIYSVKLIVETEKGCKNSIEKTRIITVTKAPVPNFTIKKDKSCGPFTAELTNTSTGVPANAVYGWEVFGPTNDTVPITFTAQGKPTFSCDNEGGYKIRLSITDPVGCKVFIEKNNAITVASNSLKEPGFTYVLTHPSSGACNSVNGEFTSLWQSSNVAGQTVDWEIEDPVGAITKKANLPNLTGANKFVFTKAGQWKVRVKASGGTYGCPASGPFEQTVDISLGKAIGAFSMQDSLSCQLPHTVYFDASASRDAVKYEWDFDNNGTIDATGMTASHTYTTFGNKSVKLIVKDAQGCKTELIKTGSVQITKVKAKIEAYMPFGCNDANGDFLVNFVDSTRTVVPIAYWKWEFFDSDDQPLGIVEGDDAKRHQNPSFTFHTLAAHGKANYWARLTVTTEDGCSSTDSSPKDFVRVGNQPVASFTSNPPYGCPETEVAFTYTGSQPFDSLCWYPKGYYGGARKMKRAGENPDHAYVYKENPATYIADLIVWNGGCADSTHYRIENPTDPRFLQFGPKAQAAWFRDECQPGSVYFTDASMGPQYWRWDFGTTAVTNPYPGGKAVRDFDSGKVPTDVRNPVVAYPAGSYAATLYVEADNMYYVTDPITGESLKSKHFDETSEATTYTTNSANQPLLFGSFTTTDSVIITRCHDFTTLKIESPGTEAGAVITSDYKEENLNCFPVKVNYSNNTLEAVSWYWQLGNGQVSYEQNPKDIVYAAPGKYTVELTVTTAKGCKFRTLYPDYIQVKGPMINFDYCEADICIGENMQFKDLTTSIEPIQYRTWNMGNGVVFSNDPSVANAVAPPEGASADLSAFNYTYPSVLASPALQIQGIPVTLTVTEMGGCKVSKSVTIRPTKPEPDFTIAVKTVNCEEQEVKATLSDPQKKGFYPFRYHWQVFKKGTTTPVVASSGPDGNGAPTFKLKAKSATEAQEYDIRLKVEDFKYRENESGTGCTEEITKSVTIFPAQATVDFSYEKPGICPPFKVQFHDLSQPQADIAAWDWDFGDGSQHSPIQHPLKIYQRANEQGYVITLAVTFKNGCKKTFVHPNPIVIHGINGSFTIKQVSGSPGKIPAPVLTQGATVDYVYNPPFTSTVYKVQFDAVVSTTDLPKVGYYIWDFGNGSEVTTSSTIVREYDESNVYTPKLVIVNKEECHYEAFSDLVVVANICQAPQITAVPKKCWGEKLTLSGTPSPKAKGKLAVTWTNLTDKVELYKGTNLVGIPSHEVVLTHPINVLLTVTDSAGCTSYDARLFDVYEPLIANAGPEKLLCAGQEVMLTASATKGSSYYTFLWTSPEGLTKTGASVTFPGLSATSLFSLTVTDNVSKCTASDQVIVKVNPMLVVKASEDVEVCSEGRTTFSAVAAGGTGHVEQFKYRWTAGPSSDGALSPISALETADSPNATFSLKNLGTTHKTYSYFVSVVDEMGCMTATDEVKVTVTPPLTITLADPGIICHGSTKKLTGTVVGGTGNSANLSYRWSKVSGNKNSAEIDQVTAFNPTVMPTELVTTYRLEVMETVNGQSRCGAFRDVIVYLTPRLTVTIKEVAPQCYGTLNVPLVATVSGGSGDYRYEWTRLPLPSPDGVLRNDQSFTAYINKIENSAEYLLTVIDKKGVLVCPIETKITVKSILPIVDAGVSREICYGQKTNLLGVASNGIAPYKYTWKLVSPISVPGADADGLKDADVKNGLASPEFLATNPVGTYTYALAVVDKQGCISRNVAQVTLKVNPLPAMPSVTGKLEYCAGSKIYLSATGLPSGTFRWYNATALSSGIPLYQGVTFQPLATSNETYYVTQTSPLTQCESPPQVVKVKVYKVPGQPLVMVPATYCPGQPIAPVMAKRTVEGAMIKWYGDLELTQLLATTESLETGMKPVSGAKTFYVTQTIGVCEGPAAIVEVRVNPVPAAPVVFPPAAYCERDSIAPLTALGTNLKWYANPNLTKKIAEGDAFNPQSFKKLGKTTFYVTQTVLGCESPASAIGMEIKPSPVYTKREEITLCLDGGKKFVLDAGPGYSSYYWEQNGATTQTVEVGEGGIYYVNLTNESQCSIRDSIVVTNVCASRLFVPTAFTPNNDGKNDVLQVFGDHFYDMEMIIYNRLGEIVYRSQKQSEPWDGFYRGEIVPAGTYPWTLKAKAKIDNDSIEMSGKVTVIR